jgi:tyrosyl-tRNA synthetase
MPRYFEVLLREDVPDGEHPMDSKKSLARRVTGRFHSVEEADIALKEFELRFSRRDLGNANLPLFSPEGQGCDLVNIVVEAYARCFEIIKSRSEARRLIEGGSVQWDGEKIVDPKATLSPGSRGVLKLDKTRAVRIP